MGRIENKVAIVTGAARGIGAAIATRFIAEGAKVVLTDILEEDGQKLAETLGENACFIKQDVSDSAAWAGAIAFTQRTFGAINILVNNAGIIFEPKPFNEIDDMEFKRTLDINVMSVYLGMKLILPAMKQAGGGTIINMSSVAGIVGSAQSGAYIASKFAVRGMTKAAAIDYGEFGVRVNSIHPGFVETPMTAGMIPTGAEEEQAFRQQASLLGRMGRPVEMANMAVFLASDESSFTTGAEFIVDGGYTCH